MFLCSSLLFPFLKCFCVRVSLVLHAPSLRIKGKSREQKEKAERQVLLAIPPNIYNQLVLHYIIYRECLHLELERDTISNVDCIESYYNRAYLVLILFMIYIHPKMITTYFLCVITEFNLHF